VAAAIVAVSPATVALDRGNISDSLMILLLPGVPVGLRVRRRRGQVGIRH
jgi:hypothetical protein